jgi:Flp pilus assembly protein TadG
MLRSRAVAPSREGGQVLVILVVGLIFMLAMVGLIVDGGNAFAQQRNTQNGTDAAADAGALVLAQNAGVPVPTKTDADVLAALTSTATSNHMSVGQAYYTDVLGNMLNAGGNPTTSTASAVLVGSGSIPPCVDATACVDGKASGVRVLGTKTVDTYIARVAGLGSITVTTDATAVAGYLTQTCSAAAGCGALPVTFPVTTIGCDANNKLDPTKAGGQWQVDTLYVIPLCQSDPGNVGWLDWTPTAGGTSELIDSINNPNNPAIGLPSWQYITSTGNVNSQSVEDAINGYGGQISLIPLFDSECDIQPAGDDQGACPAGHSPGNGSQNWYHLPAFTGFEFCTPSTAGCNGMKGAYISGSNPQCGVSGGTSCLVGFFRYFIATGTVGPGGIGTSVGAVGVQLIK